MPNTRFKATTASAVVVATTTSAAVLVVAYYYTYCWKRRTRSFKKQMDTTTATTTTCTTIVSPQDTLDLIRRRRSIFPKQYSSSSSSGDNRVQQQVLNDMLEAATWAPSHHLTEPWHFVVFSDDLPALGQFMAEQYKKDASSSSSSTGNRFVQAKYDKKRLNCTKASFVIAILCTLSSEQKEEDDGNTTTTKHNPAMEEVCSVAAAVQNMHLVATAHGVGAYWSTSGIYENKKAAFGAHNISLENPPTLRNFLNLKKNAVCLGWMFVGPYDGKKKWPQGRRNPCRVQRR